MKRGNCSPESNNDDVILDFIENNGAYLQHFQAAQSCSTTGDISIADLYNENANIYHKNVLDLNALQYVCGYLIRKCLLKHSCDRCLEFANKYSKIDKTSVYCHHRAYNCTGENPFGSLFMPDNYFVSYIACLENLFFKNIKKLLIQKNIIAKFVFLFQKVQLEAPCPEFNKDDLMKLYARLRLFYTLKYINRSFKSQPGHKKMVILNHN